MSVLKLNQIQTASGVIMANLNSSGANAGIQLASNLAPAFSVTKTSNQSISASTWTKVTYDTEVFDTNNNFASSRFTPTIAGYYQVITNTMVTTPGSASYFQTAVYKNGSQHNILIETQTQTVSYVSCSGSYLIYLNGLTDYIEIYINTGYNATVYGDSLPYTYFQGLLVRSA
jgi:hypothetical protein